MGKVKAAALARGLLPFLADNRVHVVPPCVVTADEAATGLACSTRRSTRSRATLARPSDHHALRSTTA